LGGSDLCKKQKLSGLICHGTLLLGAIMDVATAMQGEYPTDSG
jgi:acyl dehydratase